MPGFEALVDPTLPGQPSIGAGTGGVGLPVTFASGASVAEPDGFVPAGSPFSATSATTLFTQDTTGYDSINVQITSAGTGCTITYEASNDNTNWQSVPGVVITSTGTFADNSQDSAVAIRSFQCNARYFRARVSTYGSGTVTVSPILRSASAFPRSIYIAGSVTQNVNYVASNAATGATDARVKAAASTNATSLKTSAGNLFDVNVYNSTASAKFIKFYDKASAPTVGTDTPKFTAIIPANGPCVINPSVPYRFVTGIAYAITGAIGDADTTATAVDDVTGILHYA